MTAVSQEDAVIKKAKIFILKNNKLCILTSSLFTLYSKLRTSDYYLPLTGPKMILQSLQSSTKMLSEKPVMIMSERKQSSIVNCWP